LAQVTRRDDESRRQEARGYLVGVSNGLYGIGAPTIGSGTRKFSPQPSALRLQDLVHERTKRGIQVREEAIQGQRADEQRSPKAYDTMMILKKWPMQLDKETTSLTEAGLIIRDLP
jgi:hypothetical protein